MKTTKLILLIGILIGTIQGLKAQVKIGDNPLDVGANRMLEIENANLGAGGEWLIVTDSLRFGRTLSNTAYDPNTDALMLKLYGYGLGNFSAPQTYFLGTNPSGEVLEFPLTLSLQTSSTDAKLRLNNGTTDFGEVDLNLLDSLYATDTELRTLVSESANADGDTITGNEWIDIMTLSSAGVLDVYEDTDAPTPGDRHHVSIDLSLTLARVIDVADTILQVRNELADTAEALRGLIFYNIDGTLDEDRTVTGDDNSLTFTDLDSITFNADNITVTGTGTTDISTTNDMNLTSTGGAVNINGATSGVSIDGTVNLDDYGISAAAPGTEAYILGVTAGGQVVEVSLDSIGGDATLSSPVDLDENGIEESTVDEAIQAANREIDSTIYNYDGILTDTRTMNMDGHNLYYVGSDTPSAGDTIMFTSDGRMAIGKSIPLTGTTNGIRLDVNGDILAMQVHSSSDRRFKKNIVSVEGALDKVKAINGVTYDFRIDEFKDRNFPTTKQLGFIAQNVESVVPEVVRTNSDGYKAVDYSKMTALLNEAIKEQQAQIEAQAALIQSQQIALTALLSNQATMTQELADVKAALQNVSNQTMSEE